MWSDEQCERQLAHLHTLVHVPARLSLSLLGMCHSLYANVYAEFILISTFAIAMQCWQYTNRQGKWVISVGMKIHYVLLQRVNIHEHHSFMTKFSWKRENTIFELIFAFCTMKTVASFHKTTYLLHVAVQTKITSQSSEDKIGNNKNCDQTAMNKEYEAAAFV